MSAAGRGGERITNDVYPTPGWATRRLLDALEGDHDALGHASRMSWCDPCAGDGAILREVGQRWQPSRLYAVELREECRLPLSAMLGAPAVHIGNYLELPLQEHGHAPEVLITNPPFSVAEAVIRKMLGESPWVIALVRQGFVGHGRAAWMRDNMPDTYELPDRPSFASRGRCNACAFGWDHTQLVQHGTAECPACGSAEFIAKPATDAADYCWLVWTPKRGRSQGLRTILPATPLAERKADMGQS